MEYEQFLELVTTRRSIRSFKRDPVPIESVEKILEAARWAPSGANSQPWEFIVIRDKEVKDQFVKVITQNRPVRPGLKDAPVFIVVCGDTRRKILLPMTRFEQVDGKIKMIENPRSGGIFNSSLANAFLYLQLAIRTLGLGSQWVTATTAPRIQSEIKQLLKMPEHLVIYDTVALGYPDTRPGPRTPRTLEEITHNNQYDLSKAKTDNELIDLSKRHMRPNMFRQRLLALVEKFRQKGATSPDTAQTAEELDLPPTFSQMMQRRPGQRGVFVELNGKYYLAEERFKEIQSRSGSN